MNRHLDLKPGRGERIFARFRAQTFLPTNTVLAMATKNDEYATEWFGDEGASHIPSAYVKALKRVTKNAIARLGVIDGHIRKAYWIDGRSLGTLECSGFEDISATITGCVIQLDSVTAVDLNVEIEVDRMNRTAETGRVATVRASEHTVVLDASPGAEPESDQRNKVEVFIDQLLLALAGHPFVGADT